jgi:hypothetical protein
MSQRERSVLDAQRRRAAHNQSLFREVNERIEELAGPGASGKFVCECADESCTEPLVLTVDEYEQARSDANSFLVLPGHERPHVEQTISAHGRYLVVAKRGAGGRVAEQLDPRKRPR